MEQVGAARPALNIFYADNARRSASKTLNPEAFVRIALMTRLPMPQASVAKHKVKQLAHATRRIQSASTLRVHALGHSRRTARIVAVIASNT
jgi:hypothetical protein